VTVNQQTVRREATIGGRGLFTGHPVTVSFLPAPLDHGVVLYRMDTVSDGQPAPIPALVKNVAYRVRRTVLGSGGATVETCEHVLSAAAGLGIDNLRIEVWGPEMPMMDGSALPFVEALRSAGLQDQDGPRRFLRIAEPLTVGNDQVMVQALPTDDEVLSVSYDLDYGPIPPISPQVVTHELAPGSYVANIAPARTFVLEAELRAMQRDGMCRHLTPSELLVIGRDGPLGAMEYRYPDELARHKVLDVIGDLALLGRPLIGWIRAYRSGHALNQARVREVYRTLADGGA
jgi:UDP-3-O-acyl N-acetylglucosamine deacetylase